MQEMEEAKRYLENAKDILREKAGKDDGHYKDKKYVRMAGNTAYNGILEALDNIVPLLPKRKRKSVEYYQQYLAKKDKKLLQLYTDAYDILHLYMGYDGILNANIAKEGITVAEQLIERIEKTLEKAG
jgi:hypothetical protein